jgi:hypothetical protein
LKLLDCHCNFESQVTKRRRKEVTIKRAVRPGKMAGRVFFWIETSTVVVAWVGHHLNPHPFKNKRVRHPKACTDFGSFYHHQNLAAVISRVAAKLRAALPASDTIEAKILLRRRRGIGSESEDWIYRARLDGAADGGEFVEGGARGDGVESHGVARG